MLMTLRRLMRLAIDRHGTEAAVVRKSAITLERLGDIQRGDLSTWTTSMVESLARVAGVDPATVWNDTPLVSPLEISFLRGLWADFHPDDLSVLRAVVEQASMLSTLRGMLGLKDASASLLEPGQVGSPAYEDGYRRAVALRDVLGDPRGPLPNLHDLVPRQFGVLIAHRHLRTAHLRAAALYSQEGRAIVINDRVETSFLLHRRSIAHELCHALFDTQRLGVSAVLDGREGEEPEEERANGFAAEFLVPYEGVRKILGAPRATADLGEAVRWVQLVVERFAAPPELVTNHLVNRKFLAKRIRTIIISESRFASVRTPEARTSVLREYLRQAERDLLISTGRAAELENLIEAGA